MSGTAHGSAHASPGSITRRAGAHPVGDVEHARGVLGALDVARHPEELVGGAAEHVGPPVASCASTQVSLVPPPCDELTTSEPSRSATRVRPPGTRLTVLPDSTYGRKSTWRGARPLSTNVGQVDSASVGCAMYLSGAARMRCAERLELGRGRGRPDQHAVAAGAVRLLDDELGEMREHVVAVLLACEADRSARWRGSAPRSDRSGSSPARTDRSTCRRRRRCRWRWRA